VVQRVKNIFRNSNTAVECILLKNGSLPFVDDNFFYVTSLKQGFFEGACALLYPEGTVDILVSELEAETAKKSTARRTIYKTKDEFSSSLRHLLSSFKTIGINASGLSYLEFKKLNEMFPQTVFVDVSEGFFKTRLIKDEQEIDHIKHACMIADETMAAIPDLIAAGMTENELAAEINYSLQSLGAEKSAFDTICSFGKNTAEPHYSHGDTKLEIGTFVLCDFGASVNKYNSDITRTFVFGKGTKQQKEMYETVRHAQQIAFDAIKPKNSAQEIHKMVHSFIDSTPFKGRFIHSTGHSLGLAVHDDVGFTPESTLILQENMIFTIEPGVYIPGFGGVRIEDDILIKKDGIELLTKSSRDFIELQ
jgi:Xaa-Pro dipeptidase